MTLFNNKEKADLFDDENKVEKVEKIEKEEI